MGYIAGAVARWRTWMRTRGRGGKRNCARLKTGRWGHAHARPGGGGSVHRAPVEVPSPLVILRLRPNCTSPRARCGSHSRRPYWPRRRCRSAVAWGCPATDALARASDLVWCRPHRDILLSANARAQWGLLRGGVGWTNAGRAMGGALPIARAPQPSTATINAAASCIGGIAERSVPRRRARWPAQCGAVDGETYIHRDGRECGWAGCVQYCWCASGCGVYGAASG
jgi:hypothetical protein